MRRFLGVPDSVSLAYASGSDRLEDSCLQAPIGQPMKRPGPPHSGPGPILCLLLATDYWLLTTSPPTSARPCPWEAGRPSWGEEGYLPSEEGAAVDCPPCGWGVEVGCPPCGWGAAADC